MKYSTSRLEPHSGQSFTTRTTSLIQLLATLPLCLHSPNTLYGNENSAAFWYDQGATAIQHTQQLRLNNRPAKQIILFVGDGMGVSTITAARIFEGQSKPLHRGGEEHSLSFEKLPYLALSKTYSVNQQTPDSAPTMTAIITGVKTNDRMLSVDAGTPQKTSDARLVNDHKLKTLLEQAEQHGLSTGIVTTTRVTHATPAACYAHTPDRDWESDAQLPIGSTVMDIAKQLLEFPYGNGIEVVFGGGRTMFLPESSVDPEDPRQHGSRKDGIDLTQRWLTQYENAAYIIDQASFDTLDPHKTDHVLGLFAPSHMAYEHERTSDSRGEPSLTAMTEKAIDILQKNPKGYVLIVEAGRIDHAHHAGNAFKALGETVELSRAVSLAMRKTNAVDTLIIVTADHSHTFTLAGYPKRGNPILGWVRETGHHELAKDSLGHPYTALSYANGPGYRHEHDDEHYTDTTRADYQQIAAVPLANETHAGEDVAVFAGGPYAHWIHGIQEQSYIYQVMAKALGFVAGQ